uniref:Uncharacterized protein n=1 Tax=Microcebus murinus TaxID=30608 RepID=A0A8C5WAF5_MICMU
MGVPAAAMEPSVLGQSGPGSLAPWCSVSSGPSRYVLGMQDLFQGYSKTLEFLAHSAKVHSVAWSCNRRRLASGSFDNTVSVFVLEKDWMRRGLTLAQAGFELLTSINLPTSASQSARITAVSHRSCYVVQAGLDLLKRSSHCASQFAEFTGMSYPT